MPKPWVASLGSPKGWVLTAGVWTVLFIGLYGVTSARWSRTRVFLAPSLGEVIRCEVPVQTVVGELGADGDAAEDYHLAVLECNASQRYSGYWALAAGKALNDPEQLDIRAPQYLLDGAKKATMRYAGRFAERRDWTAWKVPYVKAFDSIGQACIIKADLLARKGETDQAESLLKAVIVLGYHLEQERVRCLGTLTGVGLQKSACQRLAKLYQDSGRTELGERAQQLRNALQHMQERLEAKASTTTARLVEGSPQPGEAFWLVDNDKDRMWRVEATLLMGLCQWTAPRQADQDGARQRLTELTSDPDPFVQEAARAALEMTREDVQKVR